MTALTPEEIRHWRKEKLGLTQAALGARLGLGAPQVTVADWERGRQAPPPYLRLALRALQYALVLDALETAAPNSPVAFAADVLRRAVEES